MNLQQLLEKVFHIDNNTSATIIITLIIFFLGYVVTGLYHLIQRYFERRANRKLFIRTLETLLVSLKKRKHLTNEQLRRLDIKTFQNFPVSRIQFYQYKTLHSIGHKIFFESFFKGLESIFGCPGKHRLRRKAFLKVWENLENLEFWETHAYEQMLPLTDQFNALNEKRNKALSSLRIMYATLFAEINQGVFQIGEIRFVEELKPVVARWASLPDRRESLIVTTHLAQPIKALCDRYEGLAIARELRNYAMDAIAWFENMEVIIHSEHKSLSDYIPVLDYFSRTTQKIIKIL